MTVRCVVCRRSWPNDELLLEHLSGHSARVLAEELVKAVAHAADLNRRLSDRACRSKVRYATPVEAENALTTARAAYTRGSVNRMEKRWYKCDTCPGYHLTSKDPLVIPDTSDATVK